MDRTRLRRFLLAVVVGAMAGAVVGAALRYAPGETGIVPWTGGAGAPARDAAAPIEDAPADSVAWEYAVAVREGHWEAVVDMTLWMQDRLAWVRGQNGSDAEVRNTHDAMIAQLSARDIAGNRLRAEGVEDRYVFAPGTIMQALETDGGAGDLERPVAERLWIRVYYPSRERALLDDANLPIRAITVGVNVSHDGYVLKAGVLGNLNVDRDSISYDWD